MRISDWSSDVCSSDLPASLLGRVDAIVKGVDAVLQAGLEPWQLLRSVDGGGGQRRADRGQVGGCRESIGLGAAAHHILVLPAPEHPDAAGGAAEIGSASGREIVCHYV